MIRIAICDDNKNDRMQLAEFCRQFFRECKEKEEYKISQYASGTELMGSHDQPELLFLDIAMEQMDGITVKQLLHDQTYSPRILFVSSHAEAMPDAFGERVCGFLTKPVKYGQFFQKMKEACAKIQKERRPQRILIEGAGKQELVALDNILCIKAQDKYVDVHLCDGRKLFDGRRLGTWMEMLKQHGFALSHKSYLVSLEKVVRIEKELVLEGNIRVPLSRRIRKEFEQNYHMYLIETATFGGRGHE